VVVYAAEAGHKADDGLFTPILAEALSAPGRTLAAVLTDVRRRVHEKSGGSQTPVEYNQLFDPVVLNNAQPVDQGTSAPSVLSKDVAMVQRREDGPPRFQIPIENAPTSRPFQTDPAGSLAISDALVAQMRAPIDQLFVAWQSLDVRRYMAQWLTDAVKVDLKTGKKYSMDQLYRERLKQFPLYRSVKTNAVVKLREFESTQSVAVFDVWYEMNFVKKTGSAFREKAKESYVVEKTGNGWLIRLNRDYEKD
jgi:hypothetical protein